MGWVWCNFFFTWMKREVGFRIEWRREMGDGFQILIGVVNRDVIYVFVLWGGNLRL